MPHIYFGDRSRMMENRDVLRELERLGDDYWVLLEIDIHGANIDCLVIRPTGDNPDVRVPSTFILTEIKHVAGRLEGLDNTAWSIYRNGIRQPYETSNNHDANPWQQALRALNAFQRWFVTNQTVFLDPSEPIIEMSQLKIWPSLLIIRTDSDERHSLPTQPGNRFGSFSFSAEQWVNLVAAWRPSVGISLKTETVKRIVEVLGLTKWESDTPRPVAPSLSNGRPHNVPAASLDALPPQLAWVRGLVDWANQLEQRIEALERSAETPASMDADRSARVAFAASDPVAVNRSLTDDEQRALREALTDLQRTGRRPSFPDVLSLLNVKLGYDLKARDYNGFIKARNFFDQAERDGIISYGPLIGPAPSLYLAEKA